MTDHGGAASPRTDPLPDGLRRDLIRAIAGLDGYANPNTARGDYWDKRLALVFEVVQPYLAAQEAPAPEGLPRGVLLREIDDARNAGIRPVDDEQLRAWNYLLDHFEQFVEGWPFPTSDRYPPIEAEAAQEAPAPEGLRERAALRAEIERAVPRCRPREQGAGTNALAICAFHGEVIWNGRCQDYDRGVRDALDRLAAPPTPAEPEPCDCRLHAPERFRAEARPPVGLDAAALGRVLAGYRERDGRYTPPLTTTEPVRLMGPQEWAREIAARLSAGGATE